MKGRQIRGKTSHHHSYGFPFATGATAGPAVRRDASHELGVASTSPTADLRQIERFESSDSQGDHYPGSPDQLFPDSPSPEGGWRRLCIAGVGTRCMCRNYHFRSLGIYDLQPATQRYAALNRMELAPIWRATST